MKIFVKAKSSSKNESVKKLDETNFEVCVKEPARGGMANEAIRKRIAEYFGVSRSRVRLIMGKTSREKLFDIKSAR